MARDAEHVPPNEQKDTDVVCVVSALLRHEGSDLLGVRRGTPLEDRHIGVLSTPTVSIPRGIFDILAGTDSPLGREEGITSLGERRSFGIGYGNHGDDPAAHAVEYLLTRKIGLSDALLEQRFQATASLAATALANVDDPSTERTEWTGMLTYVCDVEKGADSVPGSTAAYDPLRWVPERLIPEAVANKDPLRLDPGLNIFEVCLHGLCVRSAAAAVENLL